MLHHRPERNRSKKTKNAAYQAVFDGADHFDEYKINDSDQKKIADYIKKMDTDEVKANGASDINADINEIMEAKDKDNNVTWICNNCYR